LPPRPYAEARCFDEHVQLLASVRAGLAIADDLRLVDVLSQLGDATFVRRPRGIVDDRFGEAGLDGQTGVERLPDRPPRRGGGRGEVEDVQLVSRRGEESSQVP
jgi:hypothetical protein